MNLLRHRPSAGSSCSTSAGTGHDADDQDADPTDYEDRHRRRSSLELRRDRDTPVTRRTASSTNSVCRAAGLRGHARIVDIATVRARSSASAGCRKARPRPFLSIGPDGIVLGSRQPESRRTPSHQASAMTVIDLTDPAGCADDRRRERQRGHDPLRDPAGRPGAAVPQTSTATSRSLGELLDGSTVAYSMHAAGRYVRREQYGPRTHDRHSHRESGGRSVRRPGGGISAATDARGPSPPGATGFFSARGQTLRSDPFFIRMASLFQTTSELPRGI